MKTINNEFLTRLQNLEQPLNNKIHEQLEKNCKISRDLPKTSADVFFIMSFRMNRNISGVKKVFFIARQ
jgi:hypothetical protein